MAVRDFRAHSAAVYLRILAFLSALAAIAAVPATFVAATTGHLSHQSAFWVLGIAGATIVAAVLLVRPLDPLRG